MIDLKGSRVAVTGARGFIGKHLCAKLLHRGCGVFVFPFKSILQDVKLTHKYLLDNKVDYVIHLAGYNGGIEFNRQFPAQVFTFNTLMGLTIVGASAYAKIKKLLGVITSCAYPEGLGDVPYTEDQLFLGPPNDAVACHGYAKRNLCIAGEVYRRQFGLNTIISCPNTVYGPGDRTDPIRTKVMMAMIKKFVDAKKSGEKTIEFWGTGTPKREFIYVEDVAELLIRTLESYEDTIPLNLSSGQEYTIKELAELIANKTGFNGEIKWDISKGDGAMRKSLDITRMKKYLGEFEFTPIEVGIEKTVEWYSKEDR